MTTDNASKPDDDTSATNTANDEKSTKDIPDGSGNTSGGGDTGRDTTSGGPAD